MRAEAEEQRRLHEEKMKELKALDKQAREQMK